MNKTSASLIALAFVGALGLSGCDKKPPTPSTSSAETPSAAPMASAPASTASAP
ncbi:MAG TPA: hypothetical protein VNU71_00105 [Burkholderiaceae bacterium]|nr:hypothetical protein [Burkholderiaceae bacterium]